MELWIRSQDKECLLKTDIVMLEEIEENKEYWIYAGHEKYEPYRVFGVYHTKERALEVLDEIQKLLIPKTIMETYNVDEAEMLDGTIFIKPMLGDIKIEGCMSYIYEMPKE